MRFLTTNLIFGTFEKLSPVSSPITIARNLNSLQRSESVRAVLELLVRQGCGSIRDEPIIPGLISLIS